MTIKNFFAFLAVLGLFSCQNPTELETKTKSLHLNIATDPPTLDPRKAHDSISCNILGLCYEGLFHAFPDGKIEPALCDHYSVSEDGLTFTFYLKKSFWSNGKALVALDFERTFKEILDPLFPSPFADEFFLIKNAEKVKKGTLSIDDLGVKALDNLTLELILEHPAPYLLNLLASPHCYPAPSPLDISISNGPYTNQRWRHNDSILLQKNPHYWNQEEIPYDKIEFSMLQDDSTALSLFENKELDFLGAPWGSLPQDSLKEIQSHYPIQTMPLSAVYYYSLNTNRFPLNNTNFRKALSYAIDRKEIVENILQLGQSPATAFIPPIVWKENLSYFQDRDIPKAKDYLQKALSELHLTLEEFPELTLSYNTAVGHHQIAQAIQHQWEKELGIKVKLENKEWKVFLDENYKGQFQIARSGIVSTYLDPISFLKAFRSKDPLINNTGWTSEEYSRLINESNLTSDNNKRWELLKEAERILMEEMPIIPIYFYTANYITQPEFKNLSNSPLGMFEIRKVTIVDDN